MEEKLEKTGHFYQKAVLDPDGNIVITIVHLMRKTTEDIMELMEITRKSKEFLSWFYPKVDSFESWKQWREKNNIASCAEKIT